MELQEIREKIEKIKADISRKEGEKIGVMDALKKEFNIQTLDEAYDMFDDLKEQVEKEKSKKEKLIASISERLTKYGY